MFEDNTVKPKTVYLILCVVGVVLPYWQFLPWLATNGLNFPLFFHQLFANRISAFFGMDVVVSAVALMVFVRSEKHQLPAATRWLTLIAILTVGVSLALPLFLYLRQRKLQDTETRSI